MIPAMAAILAWSGSAAAFAAGPEIGDPGAGSAISTAQNAPLPAPALGPLGLFPGVTDGSLLIDPAGAQPAVDLSAIKEETVIDLVRAKMSSSDRALLDQLLGAAQAQRQNAELDQSVLDTANAELAGLTDRYLLEISAGTIGAALDGGITQGGTPLDPSQLYSTGGHFGVWPLPPCDVGPRLGLRSQTPLFRTSSNRKRCAPKPRRSTLKARFARLSMGRCRWCICDPEAQYA